MLNIDGIGRWVTVNIEHDENQGSVAGLASAYAHLRVAHVKFLLKISDLTPECHIRC